MRRTLEGAHAARALGASAYDGSAFHGHPWTVAAAGALGGGFGLDAATTAADAVAAAALCALACGVTRDEGRVRASVRDVRDESAARDGALGADDGDGDAGVRVRERVGGDARERRRRGRRVRVGGAAEPALRRARTGADVDERARGEKSRRSSGC